MADFMTELWNAVFEAGPTPTLLLATNVTFAALQVLLLALLVYTYSIHFVILSTLCGGLWISINWFAAELKAVQQSQQSDATAASAVEESAECKNGPASGVSQPAHTSGAAVASSQDMHQRHMQQSVESLDGDWEQVEGER